MARYFKNTFFTGHQLLCAIKLKIIRIITQHGWGVRGLRYKITVLFLLNNANLRHVDLATVAPDFLVPLVDVTCLLGDTVTLQCKVCGRPKPTITWKGPDQNILDTDNSSATYTVSSW